MVQVEGKSGQGRADSVDPSCAVEHTMPAVKSAYRPVRKMRMTWPADMYHGLSRGMRWSSSTVRRQRRKNTEGRKVDSDPREVEALTSSEPTSQAAHHRSSQCRSSESQTHTCRSIRAGACREGPDSTALHGPECPLRKAWLCMVETRTRHLDQLREAVQMIDRPSSKYETAHGGRPCTNSGL